MASLSPFPRFQGFLLLLGWLTVLANAAPEAPLVIGHRTIHVFRESLGDVSAAERAAVARQHIEQALDLPGEGWTSVSPTANGVIVALDNRPMFTVSAGDVPPGRTDSPEALANQASRVLQKVWSEAREHNQSGLNLPALLRVGLAGLLFALLIVALALTGRRLRGTITCGLSRQLKHLPAAGLGSRLAGVILRLAATLGAVLLWLLGLLAFFATLAYALAQFALTRPYSEEVVASSRALVFQGVTAAAAALPGLMVAVLIFGLARLLTQVSRAVFDQISAGHLRWGTLDAHTAPATRYLVNAAIWLFALAMSYPYLPGSQTEAFKGVSVLLGVMVSIGAAGPVGQIASGLILAYTRAVLIGEYVRIQESEGTVTHLGLCVTRLRTGTGEEIALPNSVVMGNVTRNFSRHVSNHGFVVETGVTIGYDTPWRQVHALLLEAASQVSSLRKEPAPFVVQTDLSDFYVGYRLVAQAGAPATNRLQVLSELNAAIQDVFARHGVQIMSPHYLGDPPTAKIPPAT